MSVVLLLLLFVCLLSLYMINRHAILLLHFSVMTADVIFTRILRQSPGGSISWMVV